MHRRDKLLKLALENKENAPLAETDPNQHQNQQLQDCLFQALQSLDSMDTNQKLRRISSSSSQSSSTSSSSSSSSSSSTGISPSIIPTETSTLYQLELAEPIPSTSNSQNMQHVTRSVELPRQRSLSSSSESSVLSSRAGDFSPDENDSDYNPIPDIRESSDNEEALVQDNMSPPKKKRKGVVNSKKKIAKQLRNTGKRYTSLAKSQKVISERRIGPPCSEHCRLKCSNNVNEDERKVIFDLYWAMGCVTRQRDFISKHLTVIKPKYSYIKENSNRKPKHGFHLTVNEKQIRVCKIFFKNTLGINDRPIRTVIEKLGSTGFLEPEKRGKHGKHVKVLDDVVQSIKNHIDSIPRIESHYLRQQTSREYIDGGKNLSDLYRDYRQLCEEEGKPFGEIHTYRKIFNNDYNISFFVPKKDMCEFCAAYENMDQNEKDTKEMNFLEHHTEKELCRMEKNEDKQKARENYVVACYDLQAVMPLPMCKTSAFYYKSKLNVCNFTICELNKDSSYCYVWSEVDGLRGANEIGSCVLNFIKEKSLTVNDPELEIIFYSDNCCGQQKNRFMFGMYIYALSNFKIKSITHKFLVSGHTQNENDNVHSVIEKQVKKFLKSSPIFVPEQYITLIQTARKQGKAYNVIAMAFSDFHDLKNFVQDCGIQFNKNTDGDTVRLSDIKAIKFEKQNDRDIKIFYKTSFTEDRYFEIEQSRQSRSRRTANPVGFTLKQLNDAKIELSLRKKNDLRSLIDSNLIPQYYATSFYSNIL